MSTFLMMITIACFLGASSLQIHDVFAAENKTRKALTRAIATPYDDQVLGALLAVLPRIKAPLDQNATYYLLEGDVPHSRDQVRSYLIAKGSAGRATNKAVKPELIVNTEGGVPTYWKDAAQRVLRYAIVRDTFPSQERYDQVVADMGKAAEDWENVCPLSDCGIDFQHVSEHDSITTLEEFQNLTTSDALRFIVTYQDTGGSFIAAAFFPDDPWNRRFVTIDPSYFSLSGGYDGRGVLRHELGHVLGYRHEHTRDTPGCDFEDNRWQALTPYDPHSVMHYFCGGGGTLSLAITDVDKTGHRALYAKAE